MTLTEEATRLNSIWRMYCDHNRRIPLEVGVPACHVIPWEVWTFR
jgi:hypothetical protein